MPILQRCGYFHKYFHIAGQRYTCITFILHVSSGTIYISCPAIYCTLTFATLAMMILHMVIANLQTAHGHWLILVM